MASVPKSAQSARRILDTFLEFGCRPGHAIGLQQLFGPFLKAPWQTSDIAPGLEYAAEQGWIKILDKNRFQLTELGFSKAGEDDDMNLFGQCNETVTVERAADGTRHEGVSALVTNESILIPDVSVPLAQGDAILRRIPSGLVERLIVTNPGFHAKFHAIPAHYKAQYSQDGKKPEGSPGYVLNVSGENARVNINSTDNSTNVVTYQPHDLAQLATEFEALRGELAKRAREPEEFVAIGTVSQAEIAAKAGDSSKVGSTLSSLKEGGRWVLDVAKEIGVSLAAEALKAYIGLPPH
jgi:hypothetical protein